MQLITTAFVAAVAVASAVTLAFAGALEQTNQTIRFLFEKGQHVELSSTSASPVEGTDFMGVGTGYLGPTSGRASFGSKNVLIDRLSATPLMDQPIGIRVSYGPASRVFAGTPAYNANTSRWASVISGYGTPIRRRAVARWARAATTVWSRSN